MERRRSSRLFFFFALLILGGWVSQVWTQPAWSQEIYNTSRVAIYYDRASDLIDMEHALHFSPAENFHQKYLSTQDSPGTDLLPGLTAKVEGLLTRVCLILNVWPRKPNRLRIFVLPDSRQVKQRQLLFSPSFGHGNSEAFYENRTHSIFLSLADLNEGILAHEMAHFVLCEAFSTPPPHDIQEEWARYVEMKL